MIILRTPKTVRFVFIGDQDEILKFIEEKRQEKSSEFEEELIHIYSVLPGADPRVLREKYEELGST